MEVFEEKSRVDRQSSSASDRIRRNSKVGYVLTMAGIILITSALIVIIHFTKEYKNITSEISYINSKKAEKLERSTCEVPFCNTKDCVFVAATMQESMNTDTDPCTDFYEYACGGYRRARAIPYASDHYSPAKEAQEELLIDIRKTLEKLSTENAESAMTKMKKIYDSCMNDVRRLDAENRTLSSWFSDLKLVPENYTLGHTFDFKPDIQWTELVSNLEQYQIHTLFKPHFVASQHTAPQTLEVDCLVPLLDPEAYRNTSGDELAFQLVMLKESMNAALELLHMNRTEREEFIEDVMKIEMDIARTVSIGNSAPYPYLTEEHKEQLRAIWQPVVGNAVQDMEIVSTCKYDLHNVLSILNQASNKNVIKYVTWIMLMQTMQYMGSEFRFLHLHYMTKLPQFDYAYETRWKECADVVRSELGLVAMKGLFHTGYLHKDLIDVINAEFFDLKRTILLTFSNLVQGVDQSFANKFMDKVNRMKLETGFEEKIIKGRFLDTIYSEMDIGDEYFSNVLEMKRFKARRKFLRLWYQGNEDETSDISLDHNPLDSTSNYDYISNIVRIDLGLLRPPVFTHSNEIPGYLTYGFSAILAREMARTFDTTGSYYDATGQRFEKLWWPSKIEKKFDDFVACLKNQITRLDDNKNVEVNDSRVLDNIMADMGSFFLPYEGLKSHLKSHLDEKTLPGISLNKKQTFYVQTAQMFCEIRDRQASDPKLKFLLSPKSRVMTAVSNMEDFGSVFNCPVSSSKNLENKCNLFNFLPDEEE